MTLTTNFFKKDELCFLKIKLKLFNVWNIIYYHDCSMKSETVGGICVELYRDGVIYFNF